MSKANSKKLNGNYKISWRNFYTGQNLVSVRTASGIFFIVSGLIRVLYVLVPLSLTKAENFPEFSSSNWIFLGSAFVYYLLSDFLIAYYRKKHRATAIMSLFIFTFTIYLIFCGMYSSFIATADPRNALVFYLVPLMIVSVVWILDLFETIILIVATELFFSSLLISHHIPPTEMIYNQLISVICLGGFLFISRYFATYKRNNYRQVLEIKDKNLEIERISDFKSQLLGTVAHDLRNPIATVETMAMVMEMDNIDADLQEGVNIIKASCVQARNIIDELLESARNQNTEAFITTKTELNQFLEATVKKWQPQKGNIHIELTSRVVPAFAAINQEKFQRVLDNLIGNALKFSKDGSSIDITLTKNSPLIFIEVTDHGIGIPQDKLPIIFEAFTKAGRPGLNGEQSTGLGLSIVKQIVEKHKGSIEVYSEEGKGTTFTITLKESS